VDPALRSRFDHGPITQRWDARGRPASFEEESTLRKLACLLAAASALAATPTAVAADRDPVLDLPVSFQVTNSNTSGVSCQSDGLPYALHGHLVGLRSELTGPTAKTVTYYLHDLGDGEWVWRFRALPSYDFANEMAKLGQVSLTVDEIGYDASGKPAGMQSCLGADRADRGVLLQGHRRAGGVRLLRPGALTAGVGHRHRRWRALPDEP
jgi:hypothetical protein